MGAGALRVLLTGSSGFIGVRVATALRSRSVRPAVLPGDVREMSACREPTDVVVHLAGVTRSEQFRKAPAHGYDVNVVGTQAVLNYCRRVRARLVFASTSGVYGRASAGARLTESSPVEPLSPYAMSKRLAERLCEQAAVDGDVPSTVLRLFNVYGPGQHESFLVPHVIQCLQEGRPVALRMPSALRDFVYVDDVAEALCAAAELVHDGFRIFNIGAGHATTVLDMVRAAERVPDR